ncbi:NAD(P)/FAD-dependent oxidoreductase [Rhodocaloribacter sp.]
MPDFDVIIVGGGLAGAAAALYLSEAARVLVLEAERPAAGASGAAAGLANPLMARRARPVWRMEAALSALRETLDRAGATALFRPGILRPAFDARQAEAFVEAADAHPHRARWLSPGAVRERFPAVAAPEGGLYISTGGALAVPAFVRAMLAAAERNGAAVRTGARVTAWGEADDHAFVTFTEGGETVRRTAGRVLLALGADFSRFPELARLHLHPVKGQVVRVAIPGETLDALPHLSGSGYVVCEDAALVVGSSFEHRFTDRRPSPEQTAAILTKAARMLPALRRARVLEESAGVRVGVPGTRLPMVGPLPGRRRVWVFTGLGSKGLLMTPLLARELPRFFARPETIPPRVRVRERP